MKIYENESKNLNDLRTWHNTMKELLKTRIVKCTKCHKEIEGKNYVRFNNIKFGSPADP